MKLVNELCCCGKWEGLAPVNRFKHTSWVAGVTPTDHPKSVRNCCVIELFLALFVSSLSLLTFFLCRGFCHRTESDLFLFVFVALPPSFEAGYCYICGRRRVAVARYRMICLALLYQCRICMVADLCHFVFSLFRGDITKAP